MMHQRYEHMLPHREEQQASFPIQHVKHFKRIYWLLLLVCLLQTSSFRQLSNVSSDMLMQRCAYAFEDVNDIVIIPQLMLVLLTPFLSRIFERRGHKPLLLILAAVVYTGSFSYLYLLPPVPSYHVLVAYALVGVGYSITTCTLYSSIALAVPDAGVSIAFSLATWTENLSNTILPALIGAASEDRSAAAYDGCILGMLLISACSIIMCIILYLHDINDYMLLSLPENSSQLLQARQAADDAFLASSSLPSSILAIRSFSDADKSKQAVSFGI